MLWQYTYAVSDFVFDTDYGFTIFFDYQLYTNLEDPPPSVNSEWDTIVWQPDLSIPGGGDDGAYDALALADGASLADSFTVSFVWLGSGTPGAQSFDVYYSSNTIFNTIDSGQSAPVPEPATILLVGSGLVGLVALKRKKRPRNRKHQKKRAVILTLKQSYPISEVMNDGSHFMGFDFRPRYQCFKRSEKT